MIKKNPQLIKNKGNKCRIEENQVRGLFSISRVNENQQAVLMIINKPILLRNENGYRFHSHHSKAILTIRTQSATIPIFARPNRLYIYKKWKCVESLTIPGKHVDSQKRSWHSRYINQTHAY